MPFLAALAPLIGIGTAAGGATTAASVLTALGTLGGIAGAGTTIGETIAGSGGSPTVPTIPQTPTPTPTPPNTQALAQQKALISQQLPNVVGSTSGAASPEYDALIAQILAGVTGQSGANASAASATGQQFTPANSQPTNATVNNTPVQLSDFINSSLS